MRSGASWISEIFHSALLHIYHHTCFVYALLMYSYVLVDFRFLLLVSVSTLSTFGFLYSRVVSSKFGWLRLGLDHFIRLALGVRYISFTNCNVGK